MDPRECRVTRSCEAQRGLGAGDSGEPCFRVVLGHEKKECVASTIVVADSEYDLSQKTIATAAFALDIKPMAGEVVD